MSTDRLEGAALEAKLKRILGGPGAPRRGPARRRTPEQRRLTRRLGCRRKRAAKPDMYRALARARWQVNKDRLNAQRRAKRKAKQCEIYVQQPSS